jgi:ATP phosphoribosyltransferase
MLKIGVPSKGRLMEKPSTGSARAASPCARPGMTANIPARSTGSRGVELVLLSAVKSRASFPQAASTLASPGPTSCATNWPTGPRRWPNSRPLGFGHADLIIAVPAAWIDVDTLDDLDAAAAAFRAAHGHRLRIATKYHRLVRDFLTKNGVADYQLVDSQGATEGTVKNLTAEAIADITSTGETLRANHLKVLSDGLIHQSQAVLFLARAADWGAANRATL